MEGKILGWLRPFIVAALLYAYAVGVMYALACAWSWMGWC